MRGFTEKEKHMIEDLYMQGYGIATIGRLLNIYSGRVQDYLKEQRLLRTKKDAYKVRRTNYRKEAET